MSIPVAEDLISLREWLTDLRTAFGLSQGEVISLTGAGGKTTLMYALAKDLSSDGRLAITTTTTKILPPSEQDSELLLLDSEDSLIDKASDLRGRHHVITIAGKSLGSGKLEGVSTDLVDRMSSMGGISGIIVEADGSARRSLKAPNATEPVIPGSTTLVVAVAGMGTVGCPLDEQYVFRSAIAADLLGVPAGTIIGPAEIAGLITHPQGIPKGAPSQARIVPFLNQVDLQGDLAVAKSTAKAILGARHPQIKRVVIGEARKKEFLVVEVTSAPS